MKRRISGIAAAVALGFAASAPAQTELKFTTFVPPTHGFAVDVLEPLGKDIENRSGGSGVIAMELAADANADGYTLLLSNSQMPTNMLLKKVKFEGNYIHLIPFNPEFEPAAGLRRGVREVVVHPGRDEDRQLPGRGPRLVQRRERDVLGRGLEAERDPARDGLHRADPTAPRPAAFTNLRSAGWPASARRS